MSFEKQRCEKCRLVRFCVDVRSISEDMNVKHRWLCENCYGYTIEDARRKDTIRSIMIQCGIEDLDLQRN